MAIETAPRTPLPPNFHPENATSYRVRDGDTWNSVSQRAGIDAGELIYFNFHTRTPAEVNWYLRTVVGCRRTTPDGNNYVFSSDATPGTIFLPRRAQPSLSAYQVHGMRLIPQDGTNACWYASARMVIEWRRESEQQTRIDQRSPAEVPRIEAIHRANEGLPWVEMRAFAQQLGLTPLPLCTPTPQTLRDWLHTHGPIWTDGVSVDPSGNIVGTGHVVVLAGIRPGSTPGEHYDLLIYDPWPPNIGDVRWRPASHLSLIQSGVASSPTRDVSFLVARAR